MRESGRKLRVNVPVFIVVTDIDDVGIGVFLNLNKKVGVNLPKLVGQLGMKWTHIFLVHKQILVPYNVVGERGRAQCRLSETESAQT